MPAIRSFIAIELSTSIRRSLDGVINELKHINTFPVRWVPSDNIHLTLKFLGDISPAIVERLSQILQKETSNFHQFEIKIGGLDAFPNIRYPRVIWIGVKPHPTLEAIQHKIETETRQLGFEPEKRPFFPHLTLGRVKRQASPSEIRQIAKNIARTQVEELGILRVDKVHFIRSDLKPSGAVYTPLFIASLLPYSYN